MSDVAQSTAQAEPLTLAGRFRDTMSRVAAAVVVVTAIDDDGPHGTTVSAFMALSVEPPMVLVALDQYSELLRIIRRTGRFGVNVLGSQQSSLGAAFARKGRDKFDGVTWCPDNGVPRLPGTAGWVACATTGFVRGGDHEILPGLVLDSDSDAGQQPLIHHARTFGTYLPH